MQTCTVCGTTLGGSRKGPFCSDRCRAVDLGRWLSGDYVISRPLDASDLDEDLVHLPIYETNEEPS